MIYKKSPNEFALKAATKFFNEIRLSVGEGQESIMNYFGRLQTITGQFP